jgi:hypothetical protein
MNAMVKKMQAIPDYDAHEDQQSSSDKVAAVLRQGRVGCLQARRHQAVCSAG